MFPVLILFHRPSLVPKIVEMLELGKKIQRQSQEKHCTVSFNSAFKKVFFCLNFSFYLLLLGNVKILLCPANLLSLT